MTAKIRTNPDPLRWKALAVVCAAFFMTVLDVSIVNVALPSIGKGLHFAQDDLQWVITAYAITFGGFLMLGGRAADLFGRRKIFVVGVVVFTIASFFCGLAWSEGVLIASRAVQGLGAAIISPAALAIIMTDVRRGRRAEQGARDLGRHRRRRRRGRRARRRGATKYLGWEWIFFVNVPVGAIALAPTPRFVRESRAERERRPTSSGRSQSRPVSRCSSTRSRRRHPPLGSATTLSARRLGRRCWRRSW